MTASTRRRCSTPSAAGSSTSTRPCFPPSRAAWTRSSARSPREWARPAPPYTSSRRTSTRARSSPRSACRSRPATRSTRCSSECTPPSTACCRRRSRSWREGLPTALLSVSDKTGLAGFARGLRRLGFELYATGSTLRALTDASVDARSVSDLTGFPEIMDGRVKTLHPGVHAGLLARRDVAEHMATLAQHGLRTIDLLCVNLYPFVETV